MADSAVGITAGSGTNIDTRTEATNGNHRQVVVIGDPSTNAGVAPVDATNGLSVTVVGALPAGTAAIGKLAANSGVDIGDVDITSIAAGDNNIGNVDVVTVPADPFGVNADAAATAGSTGSMQAKLRLITSQLDSIKTAVETLDNTVGGSELQVDVVGSLPAGTNAIGKLAANSGVDIGDVDILSIAAGDNNIGNVDIASIAAGDNNIGNVDIVTMPTVTETNSAAIAASLSVVDDWDNAASDGMSISGDVAHDTADAGEPVKIGGKAITANPTAVTANDRVNAMFDDLGRQVVVTNHVRDLVVHQHTQISNSTSETTIVTAGAAGVFHDLTHLVITNATATAVTVTIKDATAGTTRMIVALAASGGAVIPFPVPMNQAAAENNWTATLSALSITVNIWAQAVKNV